MENYGIKEAWFVVERITFTVNKIQFLNRTIDVELMNSRENIAFFLFSPSSFHNKCFVRE